MTLELLFLRECPHHEGTFNLLCSVLQQEGANADVQEILVNSYEEARALQFPGSPTVRVNGEDVERLPSEWLHAGFACRTYFVEGKPQGLPPRSWVERAIREARKRESPR